MKQTHKNKIAAKGEKTTKALRVKWTESAIKALLSFLIENKKRLEELKKLTNKCENKEMEVNLDIQDKKKSKNSKTNFENTLQNWLEQQEARQIETDKSREEQILELFHMKQQND
ncbi:hypothetical protein C1646_775704 [Rhizophagus diaphanus]|nr:hypothetical protein C1646_775704 [Rhizophagus diaphanus] [Rhizophagus sp. MUCL 43196]